MHGADLIVLADHGSKEDHIILASFPEELTVGATPKRRASHQPHTTKAPAPAPRHLEDLRGRSFSQAPLESPHLLIKPNRGSIGRLSVPEAEGKVLFQRLTPWYPVPDR